MEKSLTGRVERDYKNMQASNPFGRRYDYQRRPPLAQACILITRFKNSLSDQKFGERTQSSASDCLLFWSTSNAKTALIC